MTILRLSLTALGGLLAVNCTACADEEPQLAPEVVIVINPGVRDDDRIREGAYQWGDFPFVDESDLAECGRHWPTPAGCKVTITFVADMPHTNDTPRYRSNRLTREVAIRADIVGRRRMVEAARAVGNILYDVPDDEQY